MGTINSDTMIKTIKTKATNFTRRSAKYIDDHTVYVEGALILAVILLILLDIYWYYNEKGTISSVIRSYAIGKGIWLTWVWGILFSHLFMTRNIMQPPIKEGLAILVLFLLTIGFAAFGYVLKSDQFGRLEIQIILLLMGTVAGFFLWPQRFVKTI